MPSGKAGSSTTRTSCGCTCGQPATEPVSSVRAASRAELGWAGIAAYPEYGAGVHEFSSAHTAQAVGVACKRGPPSSSESAQPGASRHVGAALTRGEAQQMDPKPLGAQADYGRGEEHGLVVRVGSHQQACARGASGAHRSMGSISSGTGRWRGPLSLSRVIKFHGEPCTPAVCVLPAGNEEGLAKGGPSPFPAQQ